MQPNIKPQEFSQSIRTTTEIKAIFDEVAKYDFQIKMQVRSLDEKELANVRGKISSFTGPELAQLDDHKRQEIAILRSRINSL